MSDWSNLSDSMSPQLNRHGPSRIVTRHDSSDLSEFSLELDGDPPDQGTSQTSPRLNNQSSHHSDVIAQHPNNEDNPNGVSSSEFLLDLENVHYPDQANNQTGSQLNNQKDCHLENTPVDPGNKNEDTVYEDMTFEQVEDADLTPEERFIFMLGMLNRMEKYSETLSDSVHGEWYKNKTAMVKTILIKSYNLFRSDNLKRHNGSLYIGNTPSQTQVHKDNDASELKKFKKRGVKAKKKPVSRGKKDYQCSNTQVELNLDDEENTKTLEKRFSLDKSEPKRSQCLQIKDEVFKSDNIKRYYGSFYIDNISSQTEVHEDNNGSDLKKYKKRGVKAKKKVVSSEKNENQCSSTQVELNIHDQDNTKPPEKSLDKSELRKSQRLQIKDKVVLCDRLEYVYLKLGAVTSTPLPERLNKSLSAKQQTLKRKSGVSSSIPNKRGKRSGQASLNSTVQPSSKENRNVSLSTAVKKDGQRSRACKRLSKNPSRKRAKSLDLKSKKEKSGVGTQGASSVLEKTIPLASTSSTSITGKRKLYSVDSWLDSLPSILNSTSYV